MPSTPGELTEPTRPNEPTEPTTSSVTADAPTVVVHEEVSAALAAGQGVVALESTVLATGCPAPLVENVDATGCGNAFNAGLLASWLAGDTRATALARGVALGSAAAARLGARPV